MYSWDFFGKKGIKAMLLRDFVKKSQIETNDDQIILLEDFFGINLSINHPLELVSEIETFLMAA